MRQFMIILAAFTIGTLCAEVHALRRGESVECAYHEGYNEGVRQGQAEERAAQERYSVVYREIEEDEPGWDCKTMGNKRCQ